MQCVRAGSQCTMPHKEQCVKFSEYGNKGGQAVVYFHGAPGAVEECCIFDDYAKKHNLEVFCFDRFTLDNALSRESYYQQLASEIKLKANGQAVDVIGFSIGAHVALEVSALLSGQVRQIHLVSAAAPINAGAFLDNMAGGLVFKLAMKRPFFFSLLSHFQKVMAFVAPTMLVKMLFASAAGEDKQLSEMAEFKGFITPILKHCFQNCIQGYMRDIRLYTGWRGELSTYTNHVQLWHGTKDNWSPLSMASYLRSEIPGAVSIQEMQGLSHYSCLIQAVPKICEQLGR
jgi:pimeloyl-ACP methyl ester carboxylesterase